MIQDTGTCLHRCCATLLGAVLLIFAGQVPAQTGNPTWYDVEIVIFRQFDGGNVQSNERWPLAPQLARFERYARVSPGAPENASDVFLQLPEDALGLRDSVQRMRRSDAYEILLHTAWRQPGLPGSEAPAVYLPLDSGPPAPLVAPASTDDGASADVIDAGDVTETAVPVPAGLSGYVRLVRERYLHLEANLRLREEKDDRASDEAMRGAIPLFGDDTPPVVVMDARRRMRSGELHYMDNPRLGILVQVKEAER